jgi:YD repeat-containing protein
MALRIVVEDVGERGQESDLSRRLADRRAALVSEANQTTRRSVDESGWIFETTYDESGYVIDEDVVGTVADLPVVDEYVDGQGRLVSLSEDEQGNTFEQVMDEGFNTLEIRLRGPRDSNAQ